MGVTTVVCNTHKKVSCPFNFFLIQVAAEYYYSALQSLEEGNFILLAYSRKVPISESEQEKEKNKVNQKT